MKFSLQARSKLPKKRRRVLPVEQPRRKRGEGATNRRMNAIKHHQPIFKDAFGSAKIGNYHYQSLKIMDTSLIRMYKKIHFCDCCKFLAINLKLKLSFLNNTYHLSDIYWNCTVLLQESVYLVSLHETHLLTKFQTNSAYLITASSIDNYSIYFCLKYY